MRSIVVSRRSSVWIGRCSRRLRSAAARPSAPPIPPARSGPASRRTARRRRMAGARRKSSARNSAPNPKDPEVAIPLLAPALRGSGPARAGGRRAGSRPRSSIRTTRRCSAPTAARLADAGNFTQALDVLGPARTHRTSPDWRILSVQGAVLDQMGRHDESAALLREARWRSFPTSHRCSPI